MQTNLEKYHSIIFTLLSTVGFEIALYSNNTIGISSFLICTLAFFFLFILEALLSFRFAENLTSKMPLPTLVEDVKHVHFTHHLVLPILLYAGVSFFLFFNRLTLQSHLMILLSTITFYSIFEGQRTSFRMGFLINETLHYVYDSIKIIVYFLGLYAIIASHVFFSFTDTLTFALIEVLTCLLFLLVVIRKQFFDTQGIIYIFISSVILASIVIVLLPYTAPLTLALIGTVLFYLIIGVMHHKINNSLTISVLAEYIAIAVIILLALKGIS